MWPCIVIKVPDEPLVCLGCLATDVKLFNIDDVGLAPFYSQLIDDPMMNHPQYFCSFCQTLLIKFVKFKARCQKAAELLRHSELQGKSLTTAFINSLTVTLQWAEFKPPYTVTATQVLDYVESELKDEIKEDDELKDSFFDNSDAESEASLTVKIEKDDRHTEKEELKVKEVKKNLKRKPKEKIKSEPNVKIKKEDEIKEKVKKKVAVKKEVKNVRKKLKEDYESIVTEYAKNVNFDVIFLTLEQQKQEIEEKRRDLLINGKKCIDCGKTFLNVQTYDRHLKKFHDSTIGDFKCQLCNTYFNTRKAWLGHVKIHATVFSCKACNFKTKVKKTLRQHNDWHNGKLHVCQYCKKNFGKLSSYLSHIRLNHSSELNWCELCAESFIGEHGIRAHKLLAHKDIVIDSKCTKCGKCFLSDEVLRKHEKLNKCDLFACVRCGDSFITEKLLKYHVLQHNNELNFECEKCKVKFLNMAALNKHGGVCGDGNPCVQCGQGYDTDELLKKHVVNEHSMGEEFSCDMCDRTFSNAFYYRDHITKAHKTETRGTNERKKLRIDDIYKKIQVKRGRGRAVSNSFRKWKVVDEEGRNLVIEKEGPDGETTKKEPICAAMCEICGKSFRKATLMKRHQRLHTGEKLHRCTVCPKYFLVKEQLMEHVRVHTGERPFLCNSCPKAFKSNAALNRHNLMHLDSRRHVCQICDKTFRTSTCVKTHIKTVHMKLPMPPRTRR